MMQFLLTIALTFLALAANAAAGDLICTRHLGHAETTIVVDGHGQYTLVDKWNGSFPTISESSGEATGWITNQLPLNAEFTFQAFNAVSKLTVVNSVGELVIGQDAPISLNCVVTE